MNIIVDDIKKVVDSMKGLDAKIYGPGMMEYLNNIGSTSENISLMPFYDYGHREELARKLTAKDSEDSPYKYQKYPLIALRLDTPEANDGNMIRYSLNIVIVASTEKEYFANDRYDKVFRPVLYPLYEQFMTALCEAGLFTWGRGQLRPEHTKWDRPYWGTAGNENNDANIFNDCLDCIEIENLKLTQTIKC